MKKYFYLLLGIFLFITSCKPKQYKLTSIEGKQVNVNEGMEENPEVNDYLSPFKRHLHKYLGKVLCHNPSHLSKQITAMNMPIGNMIADATYEQVNPLFYKMKRQNIDFSIFNWGGIRTEIPEGDITTRTAFEVMPFENRLLIVELTGYKLYEMADFLIKTRLPHPLSKHIEIIFDNKDNLVSLKINKKPVQKNKKYSILTYDYLAKGGDKMTFFLNPISVIDMDYSSRDALIDYFKRVETINTKTDNRFKQIKR